MNFRQKIRDVFHENASPKAIATGGTVGTFFGFFPFFPVFGLKTLLSYTVSFFLKANTPVAILAVTLHDLLLPIYPIILRLEFQIGFWILSNPHHFAPSIFRRRKPLNLELFHEWKNFLRFGLPTLIGSFVLAILFSAICYGLVFFLVERRRRRQLKAVPQLLLEENKIL